MYCKCGKNVHPVRIELGYKLVCHVAQPKPIHMFQSLNIKPATQYKSSAKKSVHPCTVLGDVNNRG